MARKFSKLTDTIVETLFDFADDPAAGHMG
jgi:hypothetical protein